jgi:flagellar hook-associated protein 2
MMFTIDGLVSGLDTTSIIEAMLSIQQTRVDQLTGQQQGITDKQTAFKSIEARLIALKGTASSLTDPVNNAFSQRTASVSHEDLVAAAATSDAAEGIYHFRINSLARAHQIASQGYASADAAITQGTLGIQIGDGPTTTITIDQNNNTLQGLVDAINDSSAAVSATIINDGTGDTPYRLLLTADATGEANALTIVNNLAESGGGAVKPDFSGTAVQAAEDASVTIGNGAGAITVTSATNQFDDLIRGVTLNVLAADPTAEVAVTVTRDTAAAEAAITNFVDAYNSLMAAVDQKVEYDAETQVAGILLGNYDVISIQDQVRSAVSDVVTGVNTSMNQLAALGISVNDDGRLVIDQTELRNALDGGLTGVTDSDIRRLFALDGQSDLSGVRFLVGSTSTQTGTVQVDITQAATKGSMTATSALGETTVIDGNNQLFSISIDGMDFADLTLTAGTYSRQELADHVEAVINASATLKGRSVSVSLESNALSITSATYGSASQVEIGSGTALTALGFAGSESGTGQDVAGSFLVDGVTETATGYGRVLIGDSDNANTAGLQIEVTLAADEIEPGAEATLTITRGLASQLDQVLTRMLDPVTGQTTRIQDSFDQQVESLQETIDKFNDFMDERRQSLLEQFANLEDALSSLQSTSNLLAVQLQYASRSSSSTRLTS